MSRGGRIKKEVQIKHNEPIYPTVKREYPPLPFDEESVDVYFIIQGNKVPAHQCLVSQSKVLKEMIKNNQFEIKNVTLPIFKKFLSYLYFNEIQIQDLKPKEYVELYFTSKYFKIEALCHELYSKLNLTLTIKNGIEFISKLEEYPLLSRDIFRYMVLDFIHSNLDFYIDDKSLGLYSLEDDLRIELLVSFKRDLKPPTFININKEIKNHILELRKSLEFSDFEIISNSEKFKIHKIIFYSSCTLLKGTNEISLSSKAMNPFLDWVYTREFPDVEGGIKDELLEFSKSFGIDLPQPNQSIKVPEKINETDDMGLSNLFD